MKLLEWLGVMFPKSGQVFATMEAEDDKKLMDETIATQTPTELWTNIKMATKKRGETSNPIDKAIYKRLRRRLRNKFYQLYESQGKP